MVLDLDAINESLREVFTEESAELIDDLEARLLSLEEDGEDIEQIHAAFRAAHSIKGGAGALSYELMVELTHLAEAILEEYRTEKSSPNAESIALLLDSVDWLRKMMDSGNPSTFPREPELEELMESLKGHIGKHDAEQSDVEAAAKDSGDDSREHDAAQGDTAPDGTTSSDAAPSDATLSGGYSISFRPHADIMKGGNDPLRILRELHEMGTLTGSCTESELPDLLDLDPATIHIAWDLHLSTEATEEEIEDVFSWVEDECELEISAQAPSAETEENQPAQAVAETEGPSEAAANAPPEPDPAASSSSSGEDAQSEAPAKDAARKKSAKSEQAPSRRPKAVVRVSTDKIDALINMVGELVITQSILGEIDDDSEAELDAQQLSRIRNGLRQLARNTRDIQESVMQIRMLPIADLFHRVPRIVHDIGRKLNKQITLETHGEQTELDRNLLEQLSEPLVHLVRNALDHGIEQPEERQAAGKNPTGVISLSATQESGNVLIRISDDGKGLNTQRILEKAWEKGLIPKGVTPKDEEIHSCIFRPGFSTTDTVSEVSGRGVGMDVVARNITNLGGQVQIRSEAGKGTDISIKLPLTLAILDAQLVRVGNETFVIPILSIVESLQADPNRFLLIANRDEGYRLRDRPLQVLRLGETFGLTSRSRSEEQPKMMVVVEVSDAQLCLVVDELLGQQQVVVKSLEKNFRRVEGLAGATILGDGTVALILDVSRLIDMRREHQRRGLFGASSYQVSGALQ